MGRYETRDFHLACFLRCIGYQLADLRREGGQSVFVFHDRPERRQDVISFFNDEKLVPPLTMVTTIREMKAMIHNA